MINQLSHHLDRLRGTCVFPGRFRCFCDERIATALPEWLGGEREWPGAYAATVLAAAVAAAWVEQGRGGRVVALVPGFACDEPGWDDALALASIINSAALTLVVTAGDARCVNTLQQQGWRINQNSDTSCDTHSETNSDESRGIHANGRHALILSMASAQVGPHNLPLQESPRREWQPVHLASLRRGALPPWPIQCDEPAFAASSTWLTWLAERELALFVPEIIAPWNTAPISVALAIALAQLACDGWRVCWRLPPGASLASLRPALIDIGARGCALKIICTANTYVFSDLPGWWQLAPADTAEAAAMLAQQLDQEDTALIAMPTDAGTIASDWPSAQAYVPGVGRWLRHGGIRTLLADATQASVALAIAETLAGVNVLVLTCIAPLPIADMEQATGLTVLLSTDVALAEAVRAVLPRIIAVTNRVDAIAYLSLNPDAPDKTVAAPSPE